MTRPPIVLLTDFGLKDWFVGVMRGVIASVAPGVPVIDLTHRIAPFNIGAAAFTLRVARGHFPEGSVFCCVVDPGVGTVRKVVCATDGEYAYVAPDNGLLTDVAELAGLKWQAYHAENSDLFLPAVSATFHGRDVFAPLAGHLAMGGALNVVGPAAAAITRLDGERSVVATRGAVRGQVLYIDRFGNLVSSISLASLASGLPSPEQWTLRVGKVVLRGLAQTFADRRVGELLFYQGSTGFLEVAINQGDAADFLGVDYGSPLELNIH